MSAEVEFGQSRGKLSMVNFQLRIVGWAIGLLLLGDFLMRLVFLAYNAGSGWAFEVGDVPLALLVGLRFDLATLAIFNGIVLILMVLPVRGMQRGRKALNLVLALLHFPVLLLNGIDVVVVRSVLDAVLVVYFFVPYV